MPEGAERASAAAATPARASDPPAARPATATAGPIPAAADPGVAAADLLAPGSPSLKRLLAAWLLVPLLLLVPLAAALQYAVTLRAALSSLDHSLGDTALALGQLLRAEADGSFVFDLSPQTEQSLRTDRFDAIFYAVLDPAGRLLAGERALATLAPPRRVGSVDATPWRFFDSDLQGTRVRVALYRQRCGPRECEVRVAETTRKRELAERDALLGAALSMTLLALVVVALMFVAIERGLRPLQRVREELAQRSLDRLQPLAARDAPAEVQPLVEAINQMLERLRGASDAQRAFIADAAHQLRTPLTSLRTEAELALLEPHPASLTPTLTRLAQSSARAARLAGQLLALARADAPASDPPARIDLREVARAAAAEWVPRGIEAGVDLGFDLAPAAVQGHALLLQELLANLLHNALQYAGAGARVTVRTSVHEGHARIEVEDNGPGIAPADRERVFRRFDRGSQPRGSGSGLGLAIVRDIAHTHGAQVQLGTGAAGRGLRVTVEFPAVAA